MLISASTARLTSANLSTCPVACCRWVLSLAMRATDHQAIPQCRPQSAYATDSAVSLCVRPPVVRTNRLTQYPGQRFIKRSHTTCRGPVEAGIVVQHDPSGHHQHGLGRTENAPRVRVYTELFARMQYGRHGRPAKARALRCRKPVPGDNMCSQRGSALRRLSPQVVAMLIRGFASRDSMRGNCRH